MISSLVCANVWEISYCIVPSIVNIKTACVGLVACDLYEERFIQGAFSKFSTSQVRQEIMWLLVGVFRHCLNNLYESEQQ